MEILIEINFLIARQRNRINTLYYLYIYYMLRLQETTVHCTNCEFRYIIMKNVDFTYHRMKNNINIDQKM